MEISLAPAAGPRPTPVLSPIYGRTARSRRAQDAVCDKDNSALPDTAHWLSKMMHRSRQGLPIWYPCHCLFGQVLGPFGEDGAPDALRGMT